MNMVGNCISLPSCEFECFAYYWGEVYWVVNFKHGDIEHDAEFDKLEDAFNWYKDLILKYVE